MRSVMFVMLTAVSAVTSTIAVAQQPPAIRQIGALQRVSADSLALASVSTALAMPGGRVLVNDVRRRRVLLLDSTLQAASIVADTTAATTNAYGASWATLVRYRGDSALLLVPSTLSMFVIAPHGAVARVMAIPRPNEAQQLAVPIVGLPGVDARGRLVYFAAIGVGNGVLTLRRGVPWLEGGKPSEVAKQVQSRNPAVWVTPTLERADSAAIARVDLESRVVDTATMVRTMRFKREIKLDDAGLVNGIEATPDPLPILDELTVLRDGSIAIVRGIDYHIDWIDAAGRRASTPKMPFDWKRVDDARRAALIDSAVANWQPSEADTMRQSQRGRGGVAYVRNVAVRAAASDLPDYAPAFGPRSVTSDWEGNVWIRTSTLVDNRPVYDVVNRRGEIIDRVQLPAFRAIAGFGPGVIYMAVQNAAVKVHLERARIGASPSRP